MFLQTYFMGGKTMKTRRKGKWQVSIVGVVLIALLVPTALASDYIGGGPYTIDYTLPNSSQPDTDGFPYDNLIQGATVDFVTGASVDPGYSVTATDGSVVNFYDCFFDNAFLVVSAPASNPEYTADVTFHGTNFEVPGLILDESITSISGSDLDGKTLTVYYNEEYSFDVPIFILDNLSVNLVWLGGPTEIEVIVDIKPGSDDNTVNLGSNGVVPVGILSEVNPADGTIIFDATTINPDTIELAGAGVAVRGKSDKQLCSIKDLNGDGVLDLDIKVDTQNLEIDETDGAAILIGETYDGQAIKGLDFITVVPLE
jgi:hypothetical protein